MRRRCTCRSSCKHRCRCTTLRCSCERTRWSDCTNPSYRGCRHRNSRRDRRHRYRRCTRRSSCRHCCRCKARHCSYERSPWPERRSRSYMRCCRCSWPRDRRHRYPRCICPSSCNGCHHRSGCRWPNSHAHSRWTCRSYRLCSRCCRYSSPPYRRMCPRCTRRWLCRRCRRRTSSHWISGTPSCSPGWIGIRRRSLSRCSRPSQPR